MLLIYIRKCPVRFSVSIPTILTEECWNILGCHITSTDKWLPTFRRSIVKFSTESEDGCTIPPQFRALFTSWPDTVSRRNWVFGSRSVRTSNIANMIHVFVVLFSSSSHILGSYLKLGHDHYIQYHYQFIIDCDPNMRRYIPSVTKSVVK